MNFDESTSSSSSSSNSSGGGGGGRADVAGETNHKPGLAVQRMVFASDEDDSSDSSGNDNYVSSQPPAGDTPPPVVPSTAVNRRSVLDSNSSGGSSSSDSDGGEAGGARPRAAQDNAAAAAPQRRPRSILDSSASSSSDVSLTDEHAMANARGAAGTRKPRSDASSDPSDDDDDDDDTMPRIRKIPVTAAAAAAAAAASSSPPPPPPPAGAAGDAATTSGSLGHGASIDDDMTTVSEAVQREIERRERASPTTDTTASARRLPSGRGGGGGIRPASPSSAGGEEEENDDDDTADRPSAAAGFGPLNRGGNHVTADFLSFAFAHGLDGESVAAASDGADDGLDDAGDPLYTPVEEAASWARQLAGATVLDSTGFSTLHLASVVVDEETGRRLERLVKVIDYASLGDGGSATVNNDNNDEEEEGGAVGGADAQETAAKSASQAARSFLSAPSRSRERAILLLSLRRYARELKRRRAALAEAGVVSTAAFADTDSPGGGGAGGMDVFRGFSDVHVDNHCRLIFELELEPCGVALNDVFVFMAVPLTAPECRALLASVLERLHALHDRAGVAHGYLHAGNVMLSTDDGHTTLTQPLGLGGNAAYPPDPSFVSPRLAAHMQPVVAKTLARNTQHSAASGRLGQPLPLEEEERLGLYMLEFFARGTVHLTSTSMNTNNNNNNSDGSSKQQQQQHRASLSSADLGCGLYEPDVFDDLYAVGAMMLFSYCGVPLFHGLTLAQTLKAVLFLDRQVQAAADACSSGEAAVEAAREVLAQALAPPMAFAAAHRCRSSTHSGWDAETRRQLQSFIVDAMLAGFLREEAPYVTAEALLRTHPFLAEVADADVESLCAQCHRISYPVYATLESIRASCGSTPFVPRLLRNAVLAARHEYMCAAPAVASPRNSAAGSVGSASNANGIARPASPSAVGPGAAAAAAAAASLTEPYFSSGRRNDDLLLSRALWPSLYDESPSWRFVDLLYNGGGGGGGFAGERGTVAQRRRQQAGFRNTVNGAGGENAFLLADAPHRFSEESAWVMQERLASVKELLVLPKAHAVVYAGKRHASLRLTGDDVPAEFFASHIDTLILRDLDDCAVTILFPFRFVVVQSVSRCDIALGPSSLLFAQNVVDCPSLECACNLLYFDVVDGVQLRTLGGCGVPVAQDERAVRNVAAAQPYSLAYAGLAAQCAAVGVPQEHLATTSGGAAVARTFRHVAREHLWQDFPYSHALASSGNSFLHAGDASSDVFYYFNELRNRDLLIRNIVGCQPRPSSSSSSGGVGAGGAAAGGSAYQNLIRSLLSQRPDTETKADAPYRAPAHDARVPLVFILDVVGDVTVENCSNCVIFVAGSTGSVVVSDCTHVLLFIVGRECVVSNCAFVEIHALLTEYCCFNQCDDMVIKPLFLDCPYMDEILVAVLHNSSEDDREYLVNAYESRDMEALNIVLQAGSEERVVLAQESGNVQVHDLRWHEECQQRPTLIRVPLPPLGKPDPADVESGAPTIFDCKYVLECLVARGMNDYEDYFTVRSLAETAADSRVFHPSVLRHERAGPLAAGGDGGIVRVHDVEDVSMLRLPNTLRVPATAAPASGAPAPLNHLVIERVVMGQMHFNEAVGVLYVVNCSGPLDIIVCAATHVVVEKCSNLILRVACRSFASVDCNHCHFALHVNERPTHAGGSSLLTSALNITSDRMEEHLARAGVDAAANRFHEPHVVGPATVEEILEWRAAAAEGGETAVEPLAPLPPWCSDLRRVQDECVFAGASTRETGENDKAQLSAEEHLKRASRFLHLPVCVVPPVGGICVGLEEAPFLEAMERNLTLGESCGAISREDGMLMALRRLASLSTPQLRDVDIDVLRQDPASAADAVAVAAEEEEEEEAQEAEEAEDHREPPTAEQDEEEEEAEAKQAEGEDVEHDGPDAAPDEEEDDATTNSDAAEAPVDDALDIPFPSEEQTEKETKQAEPAEAQDEVEPEKQTEAPRAMMKPPVSSTSSRSSNSPEDDNKMDADSQKEDEDTKRLETYPVAQRTLLRPPSTSSTSSSDDNISEASGEGRPDDTADAEPASTPPEQHPLSPPAADSSSEKEDERTKSGSAAERSPTRASGDEESAAATESQPRRLPPPLATGDDDDASDMDPVEGSEAVAETADTQDASVQEQEKQEEQEEEQPSLAAESSVPVVRRMLPPPSLTSSSTRSSSSATSSHKSSSASAATSPLSSARGTPPVRPDAPAALTEASQEEKQQSRSEAELTEHKEASLQEEGSGDDAAAEHDNVATPHEAVVEEPPEELTPASAADVARGEEQEEPGAVEEVYSSFDDGSGSGREGDEDEEQPTEIVTPLPEDADTDASPHDEDPEKKAEADAKADEEPHDEKESGTAEKEEETKDAGQPNPPAPPAIAVSDDDDDRPQVITIERPGENIVSAPVTGAEEELQEKVVEQTQAEEPEEKEEEEEGEPEPKEDPEPAHEMEQTEAAGKQETVQEQEEEKEEAPVVAQQPVSRHVDPVTEDLSAPGDTYAPAEVQEREVEEEITTKAAAAASPEESDKKSDIADDAEECPATPSSLPEQAEDTSKAGEAAAEAPAGTASQSSSDDDNKKDDKTEDDDEVHSENKAGQEEEEYDQLSPSDAVIASQVSALPNFTAVPQDPEGGQAVSPPADSAAVKQNTESHGEPQKSSENSRGSAASRSSESTPAAAPAADKTATTAEAAGGDNASSQPQQPSLSTPAMSSGIIALHQPISAAAAALPATPERYANSLSCFDTDEYCTPAELRRKLDAAQAFYTRFRANVGADDPAALDRKVQNAVKKLRAL